jgi:DHA1 family bicyclomycin/chloramphenicol resistance-like MFS transporter
MRARFLQTAITLGLLSAIGPFAIDMYLPSLPSIGHSLSASQGAVQLSLTAFFAALSAGQPLCGALADVYGRKAPLYCGLILFAIGSLGCALAPSIEVMITFRFLQGLGACAGMVVPRAVVRDLHTGVEATRLMSLLMLVFSVSPLLAPLTGSFVVQLGGWRAVFWSVLAASLIGLGILTTLEETRPPADRAGSTLRGAFVSYGQLIKDRGFIALTLLGTFGIGSFFIYLSNSPFVFIEHYHLSPRIYSLLFSLNAASFFAAAQLTGWAASRIGLKPLVRRAAAGYAASMLLMLLVFASGIDRLEILVALLFVGYACLGMMMPTTAVLAMEENGEVAGAASALMGTVQFAAGSLLMTVMGAFANGAPLPMVAGIACCSLIAFAIAHTALRERSEPRIEPAAE